MSGKSDKERREQRATALKDSKNDALQGYIISPEHDHASAIHFVNAATVACENGTLNFMALYSEEELAVEEERAKVTVPGAIEARISDLRVTALAYWSTLEIFWSVASNLCCGPSTIRWTRSGRSR